MKAYIKTLIVACFALAAVSSVRAEVFTDPYTITGCDNFNLITDMLIGPGVARTPRGSLISQTSSYQIGVFSNLVSKALPTFTNGVILATGELPETGSLANTRADYPWPNEKLIDEYPGDSDLEKYLDGVALLNQAGIVLHVQPANKTINIPFFMASEEFYNQTGSKPTSKRPTLAKYKEHSDKFVIFIQEEDEADAGKAMEKNMALLPDGGIVEVASVNQHTNSEYFLSNVVVTNAAGLLGFPTNNLVLPMEFNGAITGLVAVAEDLDTSKTYKLKIILGDHWDTTINSAVYLRARGITSGADLKIDVTGPEEALTEPGEVTFTNTVSNIGPAIADGVVVTNSLPEGATYVGCDCDPSALSFVTNNLGVTNGLVWAIGNRFRPNSNAVMRVTCNLPVAKTYKDSALVVTSTGDYDEKNNRAESEAEVGGDVHELPTLTVTAISTNWTYGAMPQDLTSLKFIKSLDTNKTHDVTVTGITVEFIRGEEVIDSDSIGTAGAGTYEIRLKNIDGTGITGEFKDEIVYNSGVLRIDKAPLTITAGDTNKVYGTTLVLGNTNFKCTELKNGDTIETVELTSVGTVPTAGVTVEGGEYPIVPGNVLKGQFDPNNYQITRENGKLEVKPLDLYIVVYDAFPDKEYGREYILIGDECSVTDKYGTEYTFSEDPDAPISRFCLIGEDYVDVHLTCDACGNSGKNVVSGDYAVNVGASVGNGLGNYIIHTTPGKITVTKLAITITALDTNKVYGTELELDGTAFKITQGNLAEGDEISSVNLTSVGTNKVVAVNEVDGYPIKPVSVKKSNITELEKKYDVSYNADGKLRVKKRDLTLKLNNVTKEYRDDLTIEGTNFTVSAETLLPDFETPTNVASIVCTADTSAVGDFPGTVVTSSVPVVSGSHTMEPGYNFDANNYNITFENGDLKVTPAELTINVNDNTWRVGKSEPDNPYSYVPFRNDLKPGDEERDVTGTNVDYTNKTLAVDYVPDSDEVDKVLPEEIWIELNGAKAKNYVITVKPGNMTIKSAVVDLEIKSIGAINGWTGCEDVKFTIKNVGDKIPADYNYWFELKPQTNNLGQVEYCIFKELTFNPTKKRFERVPADSMTNGYDYIDLTYQVTNALASTGNDTVFDRGEEITITTGFSFYYSTATGARHLLKDVIDPAKLKDCFVAGKLFNPADKNHNFIVEETAEEKFSDEMKALLRESKTISDYIEMTRLSLLEYYHWDAEKATWVGPKKKGAK